MTFLPYPEPVVQRMVETPSTSLFTPILRNRRSENHSYELHTDEYGLCPSDDEVITNKDWYEPEPGLRLTEPAANEFFQRWPEECNETLVSDYARCYESFVKMPTTEVALVDDDGKSVVESPIGAEDVDANLIPNNVGSTAGADLTLAVEALRKLPPFKDSSSGDSDFPIMDHVESESAMSSPWHEYPPKSSRATTLVDVTRPLLLVGRKLRKDTSTDSIQGMEEDEFMCQGIV